MLGVMRAARELPMLPILALALASVAAPARAQCEVRGVASVARLRMRVPGEALRTMSVTDTPVAVRPGRGDHYRDVRVLAPIAFGARTDADIPWTVPRPEAVAGGSVWLTPRVEVEEVREEGEDGLSIRVQVDAGVWLSRVHVSCDAIAVGHGEGGEAPPAWLGRGGPRWQPFHDSIWMSAEPDGTPSVRLEAPDGLASPLVEIERREEWVRVVAHFQSGAALRGWIRSHHLRPASGAAEAREYRRAMPQASLHACRRHPPATDEYVGPAHIAIGTLLSTRRERGTEWASVSEPSVFTVSWHSGSAWVRVIHIPGLWDDGRCPAVLRHAWVPRSAVSLQGESANAMPGHLLGIE
jgi:hypothetical protein